VATLRQRRLGALLISPVTLRQLLNLDQLQGVPDTWPDDAYGWIWIIDYDNAPSHAGATS